MYLQLLPSLAFINLSALVAAIPGNRAVAAKFPPGLTLMPKGVINHRELDGTRLRSWSTLLPKQFVERPQQHQSRMPGNLLLESHPIRGNKERTRYCSLEDFLEGLQLECFAPELHAAGVRSLIDLSGATQESLAELRCGLTRLQCQKILNAIRSIESHLLPDSTVIRADDLTGHYDNMPSFDIPTEVPTEGKIIARHKARYPFTASNLEQLTFSVGDVIDVVQCHNGGWWEGILGGKRGWFQSNFVDPLPLSTRAASDATTELKDRVAEVDSCATKFNANVYTPRDRSWTELPNRSASREAMSVESRRPGSGRKLPVPPRPNSCELSVKASPPPPRPPLPSNRPLPLVPVRPLPPVPPRLKRAENCHPATDNGYEIPTVLSSGDRGRESIDAHSQPPRVSLTVPSDSVPSALRGSSVDFKIDLTSFKWFRVAKNGEVMREVSHGRLHGFLVRPSSSGPGYVLCVLEESGPTNYPIDMLPDSRVLFAGKAFSSVPAIVQEFQISDFLGQQDKPIRLRQLNPESSSTHCEPLTTKVCGSLTREMEAGSLVYTEDKSRQIASGDQASQMSNILMQAKPSDKQQRQVAPSYSARDSSPLKEKPPSLASLDGWLCTQHGLGSGHDVYLLHWPCDFDTAMSLSEHIENNCSMNGGCSVFVDELCLSHLMISANRWRSRAALLRLAAAQHAQVVVVLVTEESVNEICNENACIMPLLSAFC